MWRSNSISPSLVIFSASMLSIALASGACPVAPATCEVFLVCTQCSVGSDPPTRMLLATRLPSPLPLRTPHTCSCTISGVAQSCTQCYAITPFGAATRQATCSCSEAFPPPAPPPTPPWSCAGTTHSDVLSGSHVFSSPNSTYYEALSGTGSRIEITSVNWKTWCTLKYDLQVSSGGSGAWATVHTCTFYGAMGTAGIPNKCPGLPAAGHNLAAHAVGSTWRLQVSNPGSCSNNAIVTLSTSYCLS